MPFKFNEKLDPWFEMLNNNAKWAIALVVRAIIVSTFLILFIFILKWLGVFTKFKNITTVPVTSIIQKEIVHTSKPKTPDQVSDIQKIKDLQKLINEKIKNMR